MIRCTIELLPGGSEERARVIGLVEIANVGGTHAKGDYVVTARKTPPFTGALRHVWRQKRFDVDGDLLPVLSGAVEGHHRQLRGVYDLLFRALRDIVGDRNPKKEGTRG